jgi:large repetitive protein
VVALTAVPYAGYQFEKWSGDIDDNAADNISISIVMDRARTITADFVAPGGLHIITVSANPSLGGAVTVETPFESLTTSVNQTFVFIQYASGITVNLTAVAAEGYHFAGWKGGVTGSQANVSFVVDSSEIITAEFSRPSSLLWLWLVAGVVVLLLIGLAIYRFKSGRIKQPEELQPQPKVE